MRIGIIDSGIGGLSTILAIDKLSRGHEYIYYYDKINLPYGEKSTAQMQSLTLRNANFLINQGVDLIVLACNTAATACLDFLQKILPIPCFGVTPPLKAGQNTLKNTQNSQNSSTPPPLGEPKDSENEVNEPFSSHTTPKILKKDVIERDKIIEISESAKSEIAKNISCLNISDDGKNVHYKSQLSCSPTTFHDRLLLCTPLTARQIMLRTEYVSDLIISPQKNLASLIENLFPDFEPLRQMISEILLPYEHLDSVILGCTHYSFIAPLIQNLAPNVGIVNGNETVAAQVSKYLQFQCNNNENENIKLDINTENQSKIFIIKEGISPNELTILISRIQRLSPLPCFLA